MSRSVEGFITRMKLTELRRQRDRLGSAYRRLETRAAQAASPEQRLRVLAEGLQEIRFAGANLHEDASRLAPLAEAMRADGVGTEVAELWLDRLENQLAAGRLRSEFVYAFGVLLEQWASEQDETPRPASGAEGTTEAAVQRERLLAFVRSDPDPTGHGDVFDAIFADVEDRLTRLPEVWRKTFGDWMADWRPSGDAAALLQEDVFQAAWLRREAGRFGSGGEHFRDFADALALLAAAQPQWDWPEDGVPAEAVWTRNKWRLYPRPDLPTACLWTEIGWAWQEKVEKAIDTAEAVTLRQGRLRMLRDLGSPEVILQNEIRMLDAARDRVSIPMVEIADPWDGSDAEAGASPAPDSNCIILERLRRQSQAREFQSGGGYGYGATSWSILLTHAEIRLLRAAFPDRPVHVVKTDLRDFFASVPHAVLLDLLDRLRLPRAERELIRRYLRVPLRTDAEDADDRPVRHAVRGVPMGFGLSGFLADLLLRCMERYVCLEAPVRIVRQVDDVTILAPTADAAVLAWRRLREFCAGCGLKVNEPKSGAVCIGPGRTPAGLPDRLPRWAMLQLEPSGRWGVHRPTFEAHRRQSRERVLGAESILAQVQQYNADVQFLWTSLSLTADLGDEHYAAVVDAARGFQRDTFGPDDGIVVRLTDEVRQRCFGGDETPVPEGWVHWPVTAGGLGLRNAVLEATIHPRLYDRHPPAPDRRSDDWQRRDNDWLSFYRGLIREVDPVEPHGTPQTKALAKDFISRGKAISGGRQSGLSPYWRWVLTVYGPEILARFGTFRFLITELVPLQLIGDRLRHAGSASR